MTKSQEWAGVVLRLGLAFVFAWFGHAQITNQNMWTALVPGWATSLSHMSAMQLVVINGWFEVIASILLVLGVYTRWLALLLFLHLASIANGFGGLTAVAVRDIGLSVSCLALSLFGRSKYSLV